MPLEIVKASQLASAKTPLLKPYYRLHGNWGQIKTSIPLRHSMLKSFQSTPSFFSDEWVGQALEDESS